MVYANLALAGLNGEQYQAALHNINALYSLAQNAMLTSGIDLDEMKGGVDDLIDYVMDMIQDEVDQQIDSLEEMKDKYAEIIELKKESLDTSREESDYQDSVAEQIKEIAELQERINRLSLDDSRSAQAEKAQLEEQMAELQKQLSDDQADYAYDKQIDSLDKMQEAYEDQKDKEIEALEETISSTEKLYQLAINRIVSQWDTLYADLIAWNTEYGSDINSEITEAWKAASEAVKQYNGDVEAAMNAMAGQGSGSTNDSSKPPSNIVGDSTNGPSNEEIVRDIVAQMKQNAAAWHKADEAERNRLDQENYRLGSVLRQYGVDAWRDDHEGTWYFDGRKPLFEYYHSGGIAGGSGSLKQNEMIAVLEKGEAVLDTPKQGVLMRMIDSMSKLAKSVSSGASQLNISRIFGGIADGISQVTSGAIVSPAENVPSISFGDTIIYGADDETVKKH